MLRHFIFILICFCQQGYLCSQNDDIRNEISKMIRYDTDINFKKTPGFIVGIIDNDKVYTYDFGSKTKGKNDNISKDDVFELGSTSKVFTACLLSVLEKEGSIDLHAKVNSLLYEEYKNPRLDNVTVIDLISHNTQLPRRPTSFGKKEKNINNPYEYYTKRDLLEFYRDYIPSATTEGFVYSHANYALLELIIEKCTGRLYGDVLQEKIFNPLGMKSSFIDFPENKNNIITPGYDKSTKLVSPWTFASFKASEGAKSSLQDMLSFTKANLGISNTSLDTVFSDNFKPLISSSFNEKLSVAQGWHTIDMDHFNIITHTGRTSGHNAFVAMVRETKTAVIILSNSTLGSEDLGMQILRMINYNWKRVDI